MDKSTLLDGGLVLNGSVFSYDYTGLQVTRLRNNSSINENIDSGIRGLEVEGRWHPQGMPGFAIDFAYGSLFADIKGSQSADPINRTGGNSEYVLLNNIDPGSLTGVSCADSSCLSLVYERGGNWSARAWVRNVQDKEIVTGKYLTIDTSGFFRNYFLTEPRIFGVSMRFAPGE